MTRFRLAGRIPMRFDKLVARTKRARRRVSCACRRAGRVEDFENVRNDAGMEPKQTMNNIFWVIGDPPAGLAIVLCPYGGRRLREQMDELRSGGLDTLVSLLEPGEAEWMELGDEGRRAEEAGLEFLSFPIPDAHVPANTEAFDEFVRGLAARLGAGERIGVHCRGSIGRATVTAACTLIQMGWKPTRALNAIEDARGCQVPDTREQEGWILHYEARR